VPNDYSPMSFEASHALVTGQSPLRHDFRALSLGGRSTMKIEPPPLISVCMPVYNAERYVAQAITSILDQTLGDFEFLIIDGSTDSSLTEHGNTKTSPAGA
jgi:Glycosyl transferase family 2